MKILITGGSGFIGSHVSNELSRNHNVTVLDDLSSGKLNDLNKININFVKGDILDLNLVKKLVKDSEIIIHLATSFAHLKSVEKPVFDMENSIRGTLNLLTAALDSDIKKFIYSSSSAVYGAVDVFPLHEELPTKPLTPYAVGKLAGENYCSAFQTSYGLPTISLRLFNVYGENEYPSKYRGVVINFIDDLLKNRRPTITGNGMETRDYTYVKDVAGLFPNLINTSETGIFNIATGVETTTIDLLNEIQSILGSNIEPNFIPFRKWDIKRKVADISKSKKILGYEPKTPLHAGLMKTIEWYKGVVKHV
jgi:UDP-glucose 4-epimerase